MAALYILNLYFKDDIFNLRKDGQATNFPLNLGSEIFSIKLHTWFHYTAKYEYEKGKDFDECLYITRLNSESLKNQKEASLKTELKIKELFFGHPKFLKFQQEVGIKNYTGNNLIYEVLGHDDYAKLINKASREELAIINSSSFEAVLNKNDL